MPASSAARPTGHPGYTQTLPCAAESAGPARNLIRTALCVWGMESLVDDGVLVVTELVANAAQHARCHVIRVSIVRPAPGLVRIDVVDRSQKRPERREAGEYAERGRGLALIERLTDHWGTDPLPFGKRVWGVLSVESAVPACIPSER
jgi:serine/threonine-protein kinase RsbW